MNVFIALKGAQFLNFILILTLFQYFQNVFDALQSEYIDYFRNERKLNYIQTDFIKVSSSENIGDFIQS